MFGIYICVDFRNDLYVLSDLNVEMINNNLNNILKKKQRNEKDKRKFQLLWVETSPRLLVNLDPYFVFNNDLKIVVSNNKKNLEKQLFFIG